MREDFAVRETVRGLFDDYADGHMNYEQYSQKVQNLQKNYPDEFNSLQAYNTSRKEWTLNELDFGTDMYFDDWSKAGLENLKSGNLDVPLGYEDMPLNIQGVQSAGVYGSPEWFPEAGRTFVSGAPMTDKTMVQMPELLRHEGSHSVVDGESEGAVRMMDRFYRHNQGKYTKDAPLTWEGASQIMDIVSNVGPEHTGKNKYKVK